MKCSSGAQICLGAFFGFGRVDFDFCAGVEARERARLPDPDAARGVERRREVVMALVVDHPRVCRVPRSDKRVRESILGQNRRRERGQRDEGGEQDCFLGRGARHCCCCCCCCAACSASGGCESAAIRRSASSESGSSASLTCTATLSSLSAAPLKTPRVGGTSA